MNMTSRRDTMMPRLELVRATQPPDADVPTRSFDTLIVGGGPAGLAPLVSACRTGSLDRFLADGLAVVEQGQAIGAGLIGTYAINSDSSADTIVDCVRGNAHPRLAALRDHPATAAVASYGRGSVPLPLVGAFMAVVGNALHDLLNASAGSEVLLGSKAVHTQMTPGGEWCTTIVRASDGARSRIISRLVILATGGVQPLARLEVEHAAGMPLLPLHARKLMQSGDVLATGGLEAVGRRLEMFPDPQVAIIGSSSSALASACALLRSGLGGRFATGAVTVLHRRPLRVFYASAADALADGYDEFGPDDICPVSGFVFRFAGFRLESRELVMAARGIGGRAPEPRLRLHRLGVESDAVAQSIIDSADLVIAALGYRPRALPVLAASGQPIRLQAHGPGSRPLVDGQCRVLDMAGDPVPGLLGIGLAAGFVSREAVGGERSFSGQTNGLWQWQNDVGAIVAERVGAIADPIARIAIS
ncbi:aminotransferase DegT [Roseomonas sp. HF4]|uniref:aminotransferase DegT n=1 Tax=Roseomonas sp. HF4 TaxID=2562313 RepID=UPI0010C00E44|nr:aminotransferase DegT [Roseomonas sp. HF4]